MVTERTSRLINKLNDAIAAGTIWNTDYTEVKDGLTRAFDGDCEQIKKVLLNSGDGSGTRTANKQYPGIEVLYWMLPFGLHQATKMFRDFPKMKSAIPAEVKASMDELIAFWSPIHTALYKTAKPMIVKGRKPSETANEDARTLENTGTCPVCNGNFKREANGTMVKHGYKVEGREFHGSCFGVGFQPFEVEPTGAVKYLGALGGALVREEASLVSLQTNPPATVRDRTRMGSPVVAKGEPRYDWAISNMIRERESMIRQIRSDIAYYGERIENWAPATLPGIVAGFGR
jgi:hypothetical protein